MLTSEVLTAVTAPMLIFWAITQCELVGSYQSFDGTYCLHLQGLTSTQKLEAVFRINVRLRALLLYNCYVT
jgi:hypothetical protein